MRIRRAPLTKGYPRQPPHDTLAAQFAPQHCDAEQSATEQRNCRAAIGNARRSNADVVEELLAGTGTAETEPKCRRGVRGGHVKCILGVTR